MAGGWLCFRKRNDGVLKLGMYLWKQKDTNVIDTFVISQCQVSMQGYSDVWLLGNSLVYPILGDTCCGMNFKAIFAIMSTTLAVVKTRPEKNSGLYGIWTYDLWDTGAVLYQLN